MVVTRARRSDGPLGRGATKNLAGCACCLWPTVSIGTTDPAPLRCRACRPSAASTGSCSQAATRLAADAEQLPAPPMTQGGRRSARRRRAGLWGSGWPVELVPDEGNAAALVAVPLPRADWPRPRHGFSIRRARGHCRRSPRACGTAGAEVTQVEAYRTGSAPLDCRGVPHWIARDGVAAVTFAESSAVSELAEALGHSDFDRLLHSAAAVAIGRTTARALSARADTRPSSPGCGDARGTCGDCASLTGDEIPNHFPNTRPRRTRQSDPWRRAGARDAPAARGPGLPAVRRSGARRAARGREHARHLPALRR